MAEIIDIQTAEKKNIRAVYSKPSETSSAELDEILTIMVHGFPGTMASQNDLYTDLEFILNDKGFHTLRFDFRGCGQSEGEQQDFTLKTAGQDLNAVLKWAKRHDYKECIFISEGFGSTVCILNDTLKIKCQVMLWPALNLKFLAQHLFQSNDIKPEWEKAGYLIKDQNQIGLPFVNELKNTNLGPRYKEVVMPVLILQGSADDKYPVQQLDIARKHMVSKRIEITTFHDGQHGLPELTHRKMMFYHITQFLNKYT